MPDTDENDKVLFPESLGLATRPKRVGFKKARVAVARKLVLFFTPCGRQTPRSGGTPVPPDPDEAASSRLEGRVLAGTHGADQADPLNTDHCSISDQSVDHFGRSTIRRQHAAPTPADRGENSEPGEMMSAEKMYLDDRD